MSFRATIAVYYGDKAADIGYYRNWDPLNLLFEAFAAASVAADCTGWIAYRSRIREAREQDYVFDEKEENEIIEWLEDASEYPITVDVRRRRIFLKGYDRHKGRPIAFDRIDEKTDVTDLLCGEGIRYNRKKLDAFRDAVLRYEECGRMISRTMLSMIRDMDAEEAV